MDAEKHFCWECSVNGFSWGSIPCEYAFTDEYDECPGYKEARWFSY